MSSFRILFALTIALICDDGAVNADFSAAGSQLNVGLSDDEMLVLEPINGTRDFRINSKKDADDKPWFDGRDLRFIHCVRPAKCERIQNNTCFGSKLPYAMTSLALTDSKSQEESREKLYNYEALRNIPKCWAVIQPFLCAVFAPKCERIKSRDMVFLPSLEMCRITMEPCRILYNTSFFPEFLKCSESIFPSKCNNDVREMKFNAMGQCLPPLVPSDSSNNYYKDIEGCGVQCKDPLYNDEEHDTVHAFIGFFAFLCFFCNAFVVATFLIHDWKKSKYPAWIIIYPNICFLVNWFGWFMQFLSGNRENIVCRRDGTLRHSEPSAGENLWCIIPFILIYYFLIAATVWIAIFAYAWYLQTTNRGSVRDRIDKLKSYFHLMAWSLPLVLTITIMALSEVDGNSMTGICFVGYRNATNRFGFVLLPVGVMSLISFFFTIRGILQLVSIRTNTSTSEESKKIHAIILNMGIRMMFLLLCIVGFFVFQFYEFRNTESWAEHLNELIICKIKSTYSSDLQTVCKLKSRPSVAILQLRLLCLFGACFVLSSWCWASTSTYKTWSRFVRRRILCQEIVDEEKIMKPKHKIIADAYAKRHQSVISVSLENSHTDPVNVNYSVNYPVNSVVSNTWTQFMPYLLNRRDAVTADPSTACDSEISVSVRQYEMSVGSRRNSADSQVSVKMSETEIKVKKVKSRSQRNKFKKASNRIGKNGRIERRRAVTAYDILDLQKMNAELNSDDTCDSQENRVDPAADILAAIGYNDTTNDTAQNDNYNSAQNDKIQSLLSLLNEKNRHRNINKNQQSRQKCNNALANLTCEDESSLSSSIDQDIGNVMHSSYSAHSMGGNGKTHSRNSKNSCDVGIQANAKDIAAHTRSYDDDMTKDHLTEKKHNGHIEDEDDFTEMHQLIQNKHKAIIVPRNDANGTGYQARLERLLLPN